MKRKRNKISIIYAENGEGKSLYYQQILKDKNNNYLPFNYDLMEWYNQKDNTFSEFNFKGKYIIQEIFKINNSFFDDLCNELGIEINSKILNSIIQNINKYKNISISMYVKPKKDINKILNYVNNWKSEKENIIKNTNFSIEEINSYLKIYLDFENYKKAFSKWIINDFILFHNICVYINLIKYEDIDFLKENEYNKKILSIKNELKIMFDKSLEKNSFLKNEEKEKIKEMLKGVNINILNIIYNTNYLEEYKRIINNFIFFKIIYSNSFNKLINKIKEYNNIAKKCIRFNNEKIILNDLFIKDSFKDKYIKNKSKIRISKDSLKIENINLDINNFSNGEKIVFIFSLFLPIFLVEEKTILFDDVFEKLDIINTSKLIRNIYNEFLKGNNKKIEILTHDINLLNMFKKIFDEEYINNKKFLLYYPDLVFDPNTKKVILKNFNNRNPILSFDILLRKFQKIFYDKQITTQIYNEKNLLFIFLKYFYRNNINNNWIQIQPINQKTKLSENLSINIYNFISENIFHYSPNIQVKGELKEYFFELDSNNSFFIGSNENIDTLYFYEYFLMKFNNKLESNNYFLNFSKLIDDIRDMIEFIKIEKDFYMENKEKYKNRKSAHDFYQQFWKENEEKRIKRNDLFHSFDKSLDKYKNKK